MTVQVDDLDDFDVVPEETNSCVPAVDISSAEIEARQTDQMTRYMRARNVILSPEVARCISKGYTYQEIADALGVNKSTVAKYARSGEMKTIIEREARRVLKKMTRRDLKDEKYRDMTVSLGVLIDKVRLLNNEPTEITEQRSTSVDRLEVLLFGQNGRDEGNRVINVSQEPGAGRLPELPVQVEQRGPEEGD